MIGDHEDGGVCVDETTETETKNRTGYYKRYKVILHNDDKTTMQCVVDILMMFFNKEYGAAIQLMMEVHNKDYGIAGVYPKEQAEFRIERSVSYARTGGFPLHLSMEPE